MESVDYGTEPNNDSLLNDKPITSVASDSEIVDEHNDVEQTTEPVVTTDPAKLSEDESAVLNVEEKNTELMAPNVTSDMNNEDTTVAVSHEDVDEALKTFVKQYVEENQAKIVTNEVTTKMIWKETKNHFGWKKNVVGEDEMNRRKALMKSETVIHITAIQLFQRELEQKERAAAEEQEVFSPALRRNKRKRKVLESDSDEEALTNNPGTHVSPGNMALASDADSEEETFEVSRSTLQLQNDENKVVSLPVSVSSPSKKMSDDEESDDAAVSQRRSRLRRGKKKKKKKKNGDSARDQRMSRRRNTPSKVSIFDGVSESEDDGRVLTQKEKMEKLARRVAKAQARQAELEKVREEEDGSMEPLPQQAASDSESERSKRRRRRREENLAMEYGSDDESEDEEEDMSEEWNSKAKRRPRKKRKTPAKAIKKKREKVVVQSSSEEELSSFEAGLRAEHELLQSGFEGSSLSTELQDLIRLIGRPMSGKTDLKKLTLTVSASSLRRDYNMKNISRGITLLQELYDELQKFLEEQSFNKLQKLSAEFYSLFPAVQEHQAVELDSVERVIEKAAMLEVLMVAIESDSLKKRAHKLYKKQRTNLEMSQAEAKNLDDDLTVERAVIAASTQQSHKAYPDIFLTTLGSKLIVLPRTSDEFLAVSDMCSSTHSRRHHGFFRMELQSLFEIKNDISQAKHKPFTRLSNRTLLWYSPRGQRYHRLSGIPSLLKFGVKGPLSGVKNPVAFTLGMNGGYFTDVASYAAVTQAAMCKPLPVHDEDGDVKMGEDDDEPKYGVLCLAEVALGDAHEITSNNSMWQEAPAPHWSVLAQGGLKTDESMYGSVNGVNCPSGLVDADLENPTNFRFNEYMVFDHDQALLKYAALVKFTYP